MPLIRFPTVKGLVYTIDLSKIADRANPRTVEAPIAGEIREATIIDWGDGSRSVVNPSDSSNPYPTHEYASEGVYTIVIRGATQVPLIKFNNGTDPPQLALTVCVTSIDHFNGKMGYGTISAGYRICRAATNLKYIDARYLCSTKWGASGGACLGAGIEQPVESFCFQFQTSTAYDGFFSGTKVYGRVSDSVFNGNTYIASIPSFFTGTKITQIDPHAFDGCSGLTSIVSLFSSCSELEPPPYAFWGADGQTDITRFPNLTSTTSCYTGCPSELRAQVPTAYGGTMTVS